MTTAPPAQLAFAGVDPRDNVMRPDQRAAVEAAIADQDEHRDDDARPAPLCECSRPWGIGTHCCRCGKETISSNGKDQP